MPGITWEVTPRKPVRQARSGAVLATSDQLAREDQEACSSRGPISELWRSPRSESSSLHSEAGHLVAEEVLEDTDKVECSDRSGEVWVILSYRTFWFFVLRQSPFM